jgi:hypothetical protein
MAAWTPIARRSGGGSDRPADCCWRWRQSLSSRPVTELARAGAAASGQDVAAQREQERLDYQADLAVQSLERLHAATEVRLTDWASRPSVGRWKMLRRVRTRAGDGYIDYPQAHVDLLARPHVW